MNYILRDYSENFTNNYQLDTNITPSIKNTKIQFILRYQHKKYEPFINAFFSLAIHQTQC